MENINTNIMDSHDVFSTTSKISIQPIPSMVLTGIEKTTRIFRKNPLLTGSLLIATVTQFLNDITPNPIENLDSDYNVISTKTYEQSEAPLLSCSDNPGVHNIFDLDTSRFYAIPINESLYKADPTNSLYKTDNSKMQALLDHVSKIKNLECEHLVVANINSNKYTMHQVKVFLEQWWFHVQSFPRFFSAVASNTVDDELRMAIVENLWEEHGHGNIEGSHRVLYKRMLSGWLDEKEFDELEPLPETEQFYQKMIQFCANHRDIKGAAGIGILLESATPPLYIALSKGLKKYQTLCDLGVEYFSYHVEVDDEHSEKIAKALDGRIKTEHDLLEAKEGVDTISRFHKEWWDFIETYLEKV